MTLTAPLPFLIAVTAATAAECVRVSGDHILGKDLKAFRAGYEQVADDAVLGLTPAAGVRRTLNARELSGVGGSEEGGVCVERALQELTPAEIEAAMRKALARPQVEITILDYSRTALPAG